MLWTNGTVENTHDFFKMVGDLMEFVLLLEGQMPLNGKPNHRGLIKNIQYQVLYEKTVFNI